MAYLLELGKHEQNIAKQAMRNGEPIPERIANAPQLQDGSFLFLQAFFDLDSERSHAMAPTPIPWSSIADYADVFNFPQELKEDLFYIIRHMDLDHLKRISKKSGTP